MKNIFISALILTTATFANAEVNNQAVLNDPTVKAIAKLMNDKYNNQCQVPAQDSDIVWRCTGAILPVTEPKIASTGCFFSVKINCPAETATISGTQSSFFVVSPQPNTIKPVSGGIQIWNIDFKNK